MGGGYGQFSRGGRGTNVLSHRFAWELANGEIPDGLQVLHRCDNKLCCNVSHLWLGTQADNLADMDRKGRRKPASNYGEASGMAKLSADDVIEMRKRYDKGVTQTQLAADFGVSQSSVSAIVRRQTWPHV